MALIAAHKIINAGNYSLSRWVSSRAEQITNGNRASEAVLTASRTIAAVVAAVSSAAATGVRVRWWARPWR